MPGNDGDWRTGCLSSGKSRRPEIAGASDRAAIGSSIAFAGIITVDYSELGYKPSGVSV